jgi:hypothetical protein
MDFDGEKIVSIIGVALVVILIVCAIYMAIDNANKQATITSGTVIDKHYSPPYSTYGEKYSTYHPARYSIIVRGDNGVVAYYSVTERKYEEVYIDDWYPNVGKSLK